MNGLVAAIHTGSIEWSILHTLNDFLFHHDGVEDPLLVYINASEALFVGILVVVFLFANGERHRAWRRATVAAVLSAGVALAQPVHGKGAAVVGLDAQQGAGIIGGHACLSPERSARA